MTGEENQSFAEMMPLILEQCHERGRLHGEYAAEIPIIFVAGLLASCLPVLKLARFLVARAAPNVLSD